LGLTAA